MFRYFINRFYKEETKESIILWQLADYHYLVESQVYTKEYPDTSFEDVIQDIQKLGYSV